jgi:hypothetical protein
MARQFEVIGDDEDEIDGDVMGDVMGYAGPMGNYEGDAQIVGHDDEGYPIVVGKSAAAQRRARANKARIQVTRPGWRRGQLAPGVIAPDQGLLPLPLGNVTFALANQIFTFTGQVQKPFRGERLLVTTVRTGASATGRLLGQIFVGTDLSQLDVAPVDLEQLGASNAFGVRLTMKPMQPGVFLRIITTLSNPLLSTDTIFATAQILGRNVH